MAVMLYTVHKKAEGKRFEVDDMKRIIDTALKDFRDRYRNDFFVLVFPEYFMNIDDKGLGILSHEEHMAIKSLLDGHADTLRANELIISSACAYRKKNQTSIEPKNYKQALMTRNGVLPGPMDRKYDGVVSLDSYATKLYIIKSKSRQSAYKTIMDGHYENDYLVRRKSRMTPSLFPADAEPSDFDIDQGCLPFEWNGLSMAVEICADNEAGLLKRASTKQVDLHLVVASGGTPAPRNKLIRTIGMGFYIHLDLKAGFFCEQRGAEEHHDLTVGRARIVCRGLESPQFEKLKKNMAFKAKMDAIERAIQAYNQRPKAGLFNWQLHYHGDTGIERARLLSSKLKKMTSPERLDEFVGKYLACGFKVGDFALSREEVASLNGGNSNNSSLRTLISTAVKDA